MHKTTLASLVLALATSAAHAQTTFPLGFDTVDGGHYSYYLGGFQDGHYQQICGGLQGSTKVQTWKSLALRRTQTVVANTGRSWSSVTLSISDCDYTKLSDTWTRNQIGTPQVVFNKAVTWPDTPASAPPSNPATWGLFAAKDDLLFPFSQPYVHLGKWGTTFDWIFKGGTLKNQLAWNTSTTIYLRAYYTDGIANNNQSANVADGYTPTVTGCRNSYFTNWLFSDHVVGGGAQHRTQPYLTGGGLPSAPHFGIMGIENGSFVGVNFAGSCHQLFLDPSKPFVVVPFTTDTAGDWFSNFLTAKFVKSAVGLSVWSQAAYTEGGLFQLTRAAKAPIAALPTGTPIKFAQHLYHYDPTRALGFGPVEVRVPILYLQ